MNARYVTGLSFCFLFFNLSKAQTILDGCFSSATPSTSFVSTANLADVGSNADLTNWTGAAWAGAWPGASLGTLPPPVNSAGCRAIWCGNGVTWTTGGEGFGLRLSSALVTGVTYSFPVTYISHGFGSNGAFMPIVYTNSVAAVGGVSLGNMPAVGATWTTNTLTFTATAAQNGHLWLIFGTWPNFSSGFVNSFCPACNVVVLPVELLSFDVKYNGAQEVLAEWTTASELNSDYFVVQRSTNASDFIDIQTLSSGGNTDQTKHYKYIDKNPGSETLYYRLKQVDMDGSVNYSEQKSVVINAFRLYKLFPNPTSGSVTIPLDMNNTQGASVDNCKIEILDYLGQIILKAPYSVTLDISNIPKGFYSLRVLAKDGEGYSYPLIKE